MAFFDVFNRRSKELEEAQACLVRFLNNACLRQVSAVDDKRRETRSNLVIGVWIIPLLDGLPAFNRAFAAVTKDLATSALGIVVDAPLSCEEVLVTIPVKAKASIFRCKVLKSRPIGAGYSVVGLEVLGLLRKDQYPEMGLDRNLADIGQS